MNCKICNGVSEKIFDKIILQKYKSNYYKCVSCSFIQTDEPIWLKEAYGSAITSLDIGLLYRNNFLVDEISKIIDCCFIDATIMLDFAGGYGNFVRLMRDKGYDFYRQDVYCENLFAKHFDITDIEIKKFDLVTAFEVLEHLQNPIKEIETILNYSENAIFSTELIPESNSEAENWWYIAQETGQHIAFYSRKSMEIIAEKFGKNYYYKNNNIHLFTNKTFEKDQINYALKGKNKKKYLFGLIKKKIKEFNINRESLLQKDFDHIKSLLNTTDERY